MKNELYIQIKNYRNLITALRKKSKYSDFKIFCDDNKLGTH